MRAALCCLLTALAASADTLEPKLRVEAEGGNVLLRLEGSSGLSRDVTDWTPLVDVEFVFVPLRTEALPSGGQKFVEGREVSLGWVRARVVSDAVPDNPAFLEAHPFTVAGRFSGLYRAKLVLDPARQSVRLRPKGIPAAAAVAEARFGEPGDLELEKRELMVAVEDDARTLEMLDRELRELWGRWSAVPRPDGWAEGLAAWRAREDLVVGRNDRRPAHAIVDRMPAARGGIAEACDALEAMADACDAATRMAVEKRLVSPAVAAASRRAEAALRGLAWLSRPRAGAGTEAARADIEALRRFPADLKAWHDAWREGKPGHAASDWPAARAAFEANATEAIFEIGRASPASAYADLAAIARILVADMPSGNPSLVAAYASRILRETAGPVNVDLTELDRALERVDKGLEPR